VNSDNTTEGHLAVLFGEIPAPATAVGFFTTDPLAGPPGDTMNEDGWMGGGHRLTAPAAKVIIPIQRNR
jgi:hypothetical protein